MNSDNDRNYPNWILRTLHFLWINLFYFLFSEKLSESLKIFRENPRQEIEISDILPEFIKAGSKPAYKYKVVTYWQKFRDYMPGSIFFLDGQYVFLLSCADDNGKDIKIACLAFDRFGPKSICIKQIQGRNSYREKESYKYLGAIKWERLLIRVACRWAHANRINVYMISAKRSRWYYEGGEEKMYLRYDVTAKRSGFKLNPLTHIYKLPTSRIKEMAI